MEPNSFKIQVVKEFFFLHDVTANIHNHILLILIVTSYLLLECEKLTWDAAKLCSLSRMENTMQWDTNALTMGHPWLKVGAF